MLTCESLFRAAQSACRKSVSDAEQGVNIYSSGLFYIRLAAIIFKVAATEPSHVFIFVLISPV